MTTKASRTSPVTCVDIHSLSCHPKDPSPIIRQREQAKVSRRHSRAMRGGGVALRHQLRAVRGADVRWHDASEVRRHDKGDECKRSSAWLEE